MSVAGATHKLTGAVQAAYVGTDLTVDAWTLTIV